MFPRYKVIGLFASLAFVVGSFGACSPPLPPMVGEIDISPSTAILVGEMASLTTTASGTDLKFKWAATRGTLSSATAPSVIYTAPDSPGPDTVTVEVTGRGGTTVRSITFEVAAEVAELSTPTPTTIPTPMPTATSAPAPTATPRTVVISDFETGIGGWWFLQADGSREVATGIDLSSDASQGCCSLRCEFDFTLPHAEWPHASCQVGFDESLRDWTSFDRLAFDAKSLVDSSFPVSVTIALATGSESCWHELSDFLPVGQQWGTLTFELDQPRWKACPSFDRLEELGNKDNVRRLHILVVADGGEPAGSILIDNVKLLGQ